MPKRRPGPDPEILKIEGDWKDAVKKALGKKRPAGGWPKPERSAADKPETRATVLHAPIA